MRLQSHPIGAAAAATGLSVKAIRYYEAVGLIPKPRRHDGAARTGGNRVYTEADLARLRFVRQARLLDLRLDEIRRLVAISEESCPSAHPEYHRILTEHLESVTQRIAQLRDLQTRPRSLLSTRPAEDAGCCSTDTCGCFDSGPPPTSGRTLGRARLATGGTDMTEPQTEEHTQMPQMRVRVYPCRGRADCLQMPQLRDRGEYRTAGLHVLRLLNPARGRSFEPRAAPSRSLRSRTHHGSAGDQCCDIRLPSELPVGVFAAPFFTGMTAAPHWKAVKLCSLAAVGDAGIAVAAFWTVDAASRTRRWILNPSVPNLLGFAGVGLTITVAMERLATGALDSWGYAESMPVVPLLWIGLAPFLQWIFLPPLVVWFVRRQLT